MLKKYLDNRFLVLYLTPITIGLLSVFSFQPFNLIALNFFILPIFFYFVVYINKKSKSTFRKKNKSTDVLSFPFYDKKKLKKNYEVKKKYI